MFREFAKRFKSMRAAHSDIVALQRMDDRSLDDIGLTRAQIRRAVRYGRS